MFPGLTEIDPATVLEWCARNRGGGQLPLWLSGPLLTAALAGTVMVAVRFRNTKYPWPPVIAMLLVSTVMALFVADGWRRQAARDAPSPAAQARAAAAATPQALWFQAARDGTVEGLEQRLAATGQPVDQLEPDSGSTALQIAAFNDHQPLVLALVARGADPLRQDGDSGQDVFDLAERKPELLAALERYDEARRQPATSDPEAVALARSMRARLADPAYGTDPDDRSGHIDFTPDLASNEWPALVAHLDDRAEAGGWVADQRARVRLRGDRGDVLEVELRRGLAGERAPAGSPLPPWQVRTVRMIARE